MNQAYKLLLLVIIIMIAVIYSIVIVNSSQTANEAKVILHKYDSEAGVHAKFVTYFVTQKLLTIEIGEYLTQGTDGASAYAASLLWELAQIDSRISIYIESLDGFIPSRENPVSYGWARYLQESI